MKHAAILSAIVTLLLGLCALIGCEGCVLAAPEGSASFWSEVPQ